MSTKIPSLSQIFLQSGSSAAPSLAFAVEATLGLYRAATAALGVAGQLFVTAGTFAAPAIAFAADTTTGIYRSSAGVLGLACNGVATVVFSQAQIILAGNGNGAQVRLIMTEENVTIAAAATSTSVITLPAGAILLGVSSRVTAIGSASWPTSYSVAIGSTTVSTGISTALNTTALGTNNCPVQKAAATAITITPNTTPGDALGRIRCSITYMTVVAPTG